MNDPRPKAGEVYTQAGITSRQLSHWRALGLIWPEQPAGGKGRPARFSAEDVAWVTAVGALVRIGVAQSAIRSAMLIPGGVSDLADKLHQAADVLDSSVPKWLDVGK